MAPQTAAEAIFRLHLDAPHPSLAKQAETSLISSDTTISGRPNGR